jgi:hypothetical protein
MAGIPITFIFAQASLHFTVGSSNFEPLFLLKIDCNCVRAACLLLDYPEWAERGMGIDRGEYVICLPHLVCLPLVLNPYF